jgi:tetratricopeptide (TPR) repeat protein
MTSMELILTKVNIKKKQLDTAFIYAEIEVKKNPTSYVGWYLLGYLKSEKKDYLGMIEAFKKCLEINPKTYKNEISNITRYHWALVFNSGVSKFNKAKEEGKDEWIDDSINDFKTALLIIPDSIETYWNLAACYQKKGDLEKAEEILLYLAKSKNELNAYIMLGDIFLENGNKYKIKYENDNREKIELKNKIESITSKISKRTVKIHLNDPDEIIKIQYDTIEIGTKVTEEWIYHRLNLHVYFNSDLVVGKNIEPELDFTINTTDLTNAIREYDKAIYWYSKAESIAPEPIKVSIIESLTKLYSSTDRLDVAIYFLEDLIEKEPNKKEYYYFLGVLYLNNKRYEKAITQFKRVIDLDPTDEKSLYNLFATFNNWAIKIKEETINSEKDDTSYLKVLRQGLPYIERLNELKSDNLDYIDPLRQLYGIFQMKSQLEELFTRTESLRDKFKDSPYYHEIISKFYMCLNKQDEAIKILSKIDQSLVTTTKVTTKVSYTVKKSIELIPDIDLLSPSSNPYKSAHINLSLIASFKNIKNENDVTIKLNDSIIDAVPEKNKISDYILLIWNISLNNIHNEIEITAKNDVGITSSKLIVEKSVDKIQEDIILSRIFAVVVGISNYKKSELNLNFADRDAHFFYNFLQSPNGGSISSEDSALLMNNNAIRSEVLKEINEKCKHAFEEDTIIIFMACHGMPDPIGKEVYFLSYDSEPDNIEGTGISQNDIEKALNRSKAKKKIWIVDACHSGGIGLTTRGYNNIVAKFLLATHSKEGFPMLSASSANQSSFEDTKWGGGHGVFTYYLLEGLKGNADKDQDGLIGIRELFDYIYDNVKKDTKGQQYPEIKGRFDDKLPLGIV